MEKNKQTKNTCFPYYRARPPDVEWRSISRDRSSACSPVWRHPHGPCWGPCSACCPLWAAACRRSRTTTTSSSTARATSSCWACDSSWRTSPRLTTWCMVSLLYHFSKSQSHDQVYAELAVSHRWVCCVTSLKAGHMVKAWWASCVTSVKPVTWSGVWWACCVTSLKDSHMVRCMVCLLCHFSKS